MPMGCMFFGYWCQFTAHCQANFTPIMMIQPHDVKPALIPVTSKKGTLVHTVL